MSANECWKAPASNELLTTGFGGRMALIETLLMANHAELHDGLLYLMGAGWADVRQTIPPGQPPPPFHFGVGMTIMIGWSEASAATTS